jgi:uncharacterized protein HemX
MTGLESHILFKWLPIIFILVLIIIISLGLSYWYFAHRRRKIQNSSKKKPEEKTTNAQTKPMQRTLLPKNEYLSYPKHNLTCSTSSSQLTNTDIAYLDKLVRTASDRSMWKRDYSKKDSSNQPRKVPSGLM